MTTVFLTFLPPFPWASPADLPVLLHPPSSTIQFGGELFTRVLAGRILVSERNLIETKTSSKGPLTFIKSMYAHSFAKPDVSLHIKSALRSH